MCFPTLAYELDGRWSRSTIDGLNGIQGDPITLTWSIVPDGTTTFEKNELNQNQPSDLIDFFDALYGSGGSTSDDYSSRPWFFIFEDSFDRISDLSGVSFVYLPNDAGTKQSFFSTDGSLSAPRGDIRIAGTSIDGQSGSNTLAYNYYPDVGDMVIDTDNTDFYNRRSTNSLSARNVIMHEVGHGLGIAHVLSDSSTSAHSLNCPGCAVCGVRERDPNDATTTPGGQFLMEPFITTSFDGPQLDDILALHRGYGDVYEKSNGGAGNDAAANATDLGVLANGLVRSIGTDADDTFVASGDTDFVSIDDNSDVDFFSFTLTERSILGMVLTPKGPTYNAGPQPQSENDEVVQEPLDTSALSDLTLTLLDADGSTQLAFSNSGGLGDSESILDFELSEAGTYFVRVGGLNNDVQLYQLDLFAELIELLLGDLNNDGLVDQDDADLVLGSFGRTVEAGSLLDGDASGDGYVDANDLRIVLNNWSDPSGPAAITPEPGGLAMMAGAMLFGLSRRRRQS